MSDVAIVFVLAILTGGWSIPVGLLLDLSPQAVYVSAIAGGLSFAGTVLLLGGKARDFVVGRLGAGGEGKIRSGRVGKLVERTGLIGLATVGQVLFGPSLALAAALIFGFDRRRFARWYVVGTIVGYGLFVVFWMVVLD